MPILVFQRDREKGLTRELCDGSAWGYGPSIIALCTHEEQHLALYLPGNLITAERESYNYTGVRSEKAL